MLTIKAYRPPGRMERGFAIVALIFFSGAFIPLIRRANGFQFSVEQGDVISQAVFLGIEIITFFLLLPHWKQVLRVARRNFFMSLLILYVLASIFWSPNFTISFRRGVAILGTTLFAVYLVTRYSQRAQMQLLFWGLSVAAIISLIVIVAMPSLGVTNDSINAGSWRGIFTQKNTLGRMMGLNALLCFAIAITEQRYRRRSWILFALSLGLIAMARSVTPLLSVFFVLPLVPSYKFLRRRWPPMLVVPAIVTVVLLGGVLVAAIVTNLDFAVQVIGKDLTLTGRTKLWATVIEIGSESDFRRWFGYGYNGFWLGNVGDSARVWQVNTWKPIHAHNGFLDVWLDLGVIGLVLFVIVFFATLIRSVRRLNFIAYADEIWPFLFLAYFLIVNMTQGVVMRPNNLFWVIFASVAWNLSPESKTFRFRRENVQSFPPPDHMKKYQWSAK